MRVEFSKEFEKAVRKLSGKMLEQKDLEKVEERRKELQKKEKELRTKIELETAKEEAKKNEEIRKSLGCEADGGVFRRN